MRLHRAFLLFGLAIFFSTPFAPPVAAQECPCRTTPTGACVPDRECESRAHQFRHQHERAFRRPPLSGSIDLPSLAPPPEAALPAPPLPGLPAPPPATVTEAGSAGPRPRILNTGYGQLTELGGEVPGFGLYSYVIMPVPSPRAARMLTEIFTDVPSIGELPTDPPQLNVLYIPLRKDNAAGFAELRRQFGSTPDKMAANYTATFYDYGTASALLDAVCNPPAASIRELCAGDLSRGPYLFTYAAPASKMKSVPPPFLFVDLSEVEPDAFGELLAAFRAQVKRDDISDKQRIETLRLTVLQYLLKAGALVTPMQKAIAGIIHAATADADQPDAK